jgi:hypothetical protein
MENDAWYLLVLIFQSCSAVIASEGIRNTINAKWLYYKITWLSAHYHVFLYTIVLVCSNQCWVLYYAFYLHLLLQFQTFTSSTVNQGRTYFFEFYSFRWLLSVNCIFHVCAIARWKKLWATTILYLFQSILIPTCSPLCVSYVCLLYLWIAPIAFGALMTLEAAQLTGNSIYYVSNETADYTSITIIVIIGYVSQVIENDTLRD